MATKKPNNATITAESAPGDPASDGADDLAVLNPDIILTIKGRAITVREYGFIEGLQLEPIIKPFIDALHQAMKPGVSPPLSDIVALLGEHHEITTQMICQSCGVDKEWLCSLSDGEGTNLLHAWWSVCAPFVLQRVFNRWTAEKALANRNAGASSTKS